MDIRSIYQISWAVILLPLFGCSGGGGGDGTGTGTSNRTPVASAGSDQIVQKNVLVSLDAAASTDPDGDTLSYRWTQTAGTTVALSTASGAKPTFVAPSKSGILTFSLVVSDGKSESAADTIDITVNNSAPTASVDGDVTAQIGSKVTLSGVKSSDPDGDTLTYQWTQISGPTVSISASSPGLAQFTAPNSITLLAFSLTVSDGEASSVQIIIIVNITTNVTNRPPAASAGPDQTVPKNRTVLLNGNGYDPDGTAVTVQWTQTAGPTVTLNNPSARNPTFVAPSSSAVLSFEFKVSDGLAATTDSVTITVQNFAPSLTVTLSPNPAYTNDNLSVSKSAVDADGDSLNFSYVWQRNGVIVGGQTSSTFPASLTTKGDVIKVSVSASDGTTTNTTEASTTIADSSPVLSAVGAPTSVNYGNTLNFSMTATDADGDPIGPFKVLYGPAGLSIDSSGNVSWLATGPMFDRTVDIDWAIGLNNHPTAMLTGSFQWIDTGRQYPLRRMGLEAPTNHNTMVVTDLNGDGIAEMLIAGNASIQERKKVGNTYELSWVYPFDFSQGTGANQAVTAADINSDSKQEIFASAGNLVIRLDGVSRREATRRNFGNGKYCLAMKAADIDNDGTIELVCLMSSSPYSGNSWITVLNPTDLSTKWETAAGSLGYSFAIGNVDSDAALEIVTSGGYVYDGSSHQNQWAYGPGFGMLVDVGDVDGDGIGDIVGAIDWSAVRAFSAVSKSPLWEIMKSDIDEIRLADLTNDGKAEILVGDGQWGNVTAYSYNTTSHNPDVLFQINSQDHGVSCLGVGNVDGDSALEVIWGTGLSHSGADLLVIAGLTPTATVKWKSSGTDQLDTYFGGPLANIGAGQSRLMFGTPRSSSGYAGMRLIGLDASTGRFTSSSEIDSNWNGTGTLDVVDYDGDGVQEIFLSTAQIYNGYLAAYDFATNTKEWTSAQSSGNATGAITHADINADGFADLVRISIDSHVEVHDVKNSALIWGSTGLGGSGVDVVAADLDGDGLTEIIAATSTRIYVYGRATQNSSFVERANYPLSNAVDLAVADTDGDNVPEIYALGGNGTNIYVLNAQLQLSRTLNLGTTGTSLTIEKSVFPRKNLLVGTMTTNLVYPYYGTSQIWAVDPITGADVWRSPYFLGSVTKNSLFFVDSNNDGISEISFASASGFHVTR